MLGRLETGSFASSPALKLGWSWLLFLCETTLHWASGKAVALKGPRVWGMNSQTHLGEGSVIRSVSYRLCARLGAALKLPVGHTGPLALGFSTCFHSGKQHPPRLRGLRSSCSSSSIFSSHRIMADISLWNRTLYSAFHSH